MLVGAVAVDPEGALQLRTDQAGDRTPVDGVEERVGLRVGRALARLLGGGGSRLAGEGKQENVHALPERQQPIQDRERFRVAILQDRRPHRHLGGEGHQAVDVDDLDARDHARVRQRGERPLHGVERVQPERLGVGHRDRLGLGVRATRVHEVAPRSVWLACRRSTLHLCQSWRRSDNTMITYFI